ncbi:putative peroxisomal enoyl-coa hydratase [Leptomonas pyrrhocoris]|uniref:Putative peroxisomal enoyl-coa hydratase n=1 Tax=Leptomonas pyrrhocoris TaxID=157538 RepID=A0A0M9FY60_LEPPY|nr:putative peroxisomal enoyl-coa hydratase [Leptomonas pyrrhocoris]KPA78530.1 putative peroxisomal enoyl-coa hydratase [Leptomonas pyrrhocoris]|eukprot:XP_015656969.1 putative peroxisomal enoyl-coa hydratase [Leptomonas pyrrhocoris]
MKHSLRLLSSAEDSSLIRCIGPFHVCRSSTAKGVIEVLSGDPKHPVQKLNLLGADYFSALKGVAALLSEELNDEARVAIFAPREKCSFSAGIDLKELAGGLVTTEADVAGSKYPAMRLQQQHRMVRVFQDGVSSLARCRIPIIAAIDPHCVGGATSVASACDLRYATSRSVFSVKEAAVGLAADIGVLQRLPAIIGEGRTRELAFTCREFDGEEAKRIGFVEEVCTDYAALMAHARRRAAEVASNSPLGVQNSKRILNGQREKAVQESLEYQAAISAFSPSCHDVAEAAHAFAGKRAPVFTDYVVNPTGGHARSNPKGS